MGQRSKFEQMFKHFVNSFIEAEEEAQKQAEQEAAIMDAAYRASKLQPQPGVAPASQPQSPQSNETGEQIHIHVHRN